MLPFQRTTGSKWKKAIRQWTKKDMEHENDGDTNCNLYLEKILWKLEIRECIDTLQIT